MKRILGKAGKGTRLLATVLFLGMISGALGGTAAEEKKSSAPPAKPEAGAAKTKVVFADPKLEALVRKALKKAEGDLSPEDLRGLKILDGSSAGIESLAGLEAASNLTELMLNKNKIRDLSPLSGLNRLQILRLGSNQITDLSSCANLTSLVHLAIPDNQIKDLTSLKGLTKLEFLNLSGNQISDLSPLAGLTKLHYLNAAQNQIADLAPLIKLCDSDGLCQKVSGAQIGYIVLAGNPLSEKARKEQVPHLQGKAKVVLLETEKVEEKSK